MSRREMARVPVLVVKDQCHEEHLRYQQTVAAQRQFEDRFQALARRTFNAAFECRVGRDGADVVEALAEAIAPLLGHSPQTLDAPEGWVQLIHPNDHAVVAAHVRRVLSGQRDLCVFRALTPAGMVRWFGALTRPVKEATGRRVAHVYGLVQDYSASAEVLASRRETGRAPHARPPLACPSTP